MSQPILHPQTRLVLSQFLEQPTHGLILTGPEGSGKYYVATWLAKQIAQTTYTLKANEAKSTISIDQVRELYAMTRTGTSTVVIIQDAHQMGHEAQNAFLKLLEEPPQSTWFILTSQQQQSLLPTIRSRSQQITINSPLPHDLEEYAKQHDLDSQEVKTLLHTSRGLVGSFISLLKNPVKLDEHRQEVAIAKKFYSASAFERQQLLVEHKFDKIWIQQLLDMLVLIIEALLRSKTAEPTALQRLSQQASLIETTRHYIVNLPGNPKIHLTKLALQL